MYNLCGFAHNIQNIYKLSSSFSKNNSIKTIDDLKPFYLDFLQNSYNYSEINRTKNLIIKNKEIENQLISSFSESNLNDLNQENMIGNSYSDEYHKIISNNLNNNIDKLNKLNHEFYELFRLSIHSIIICSSKINQSRMKANGGTSNKLIGLIWLNLKPDLLDQDIQEMLIHELTHTLVFLDELNFGHFNYNNLSKKEFWAKSSILQMQRPMDKVIHSIIVSSELLLARNTFLSNKDSVSLHPNSKNLKTNTLSAIDSVFNLKNIDDVCLPRSIELVEKAQKCVINL